MKRFVSTRYPRLKDVNKAISDDVLIFGFFNIVLGVALYSDIARTLDFFIINDVFTNQVWGVAFFLAGIVLLVSHYLNLWRVIRGALVFCLFLKFMWIAALTARQFEALNTNVFLILMFITLGVGQISTYLRFPGVKQWQR